MWQSLIWISITHFFSDYTFEAKLTRKDILSWQAFAINQQRDELNPLQIEQLCLNKRLCFILLGIFGKYLERSYIYIVTDVIKIGYDYNEKK
jgi:hypothetical protein